MVDVISVGVFCLRKLMSFWFIFSLVFCVEMGMWVDFFVNLLFKFILIVLYILVLYMWWMIFMKIRVLSIDVNLYNLDMCFFSSLLMVNLMNKGVSVIRVVLIKVKIYVSVIGW